MSGDAAAPETPTEPEVVSAAEPPYRLSGSQRALVALTVLGPPALGALFLLSGLPGRIWDRLLQGDASEPNDRLADARRVAPGRLVGLQCRAGDVDWFTLEVPDGSALRVAASEVEGEGELSVHDPRTGMQVARAPLAEHWPPILSWVPPPGGGAAAVRVTGDARYALELALIDPGARFERPGRAAALLAAGEHGGIRLDGDDCYLIERLPLRPLRVTLGGAAGLKLVSKEARVDPTGRVAELPARATRGFTELTVKGGLRGLVYSLAVEHLQPVDARAGRRDVAPVTVVRGPREPNDDPASAPALEAGMHLGLRCDGVDHYWFTAPTAGTLEAYLLPGEGPDREALGWMVLEVLPESGAEGPRGGWGASTRLELAAGERARITVHGNRPRGEGPMGYGLRLDLRPPPGPVEPLEPGTCTRLCSGSDRFAIALQPGDTARLMLSWDASRGRLGLRLGQRSHDADDHGARTAGEETVVAEYAAFRAETLEAVVEGDRIPYDLQLEVVPAKAGAPPPVERLPQSGRSLRYLRVAAGQSLSIELRGQDPRQDVDIYLQDENGSQLTSSTSPRHVESIRWVARADAALGLLIQGPVGAAYQLAVEVRDPLPAGTVAPLLEPGSLIDQPCAGAIDRTIVLPAGAQLTVVARPSSPELPPVRLVLTDPSGVEVSEGEGDPCELLFVADQDGPHWLRIEGPPGAETRFDLLVQVDDR